MNNIIEEYIDLDIINEELLFQNGKVVVNNETHVLPVNHYVTGVMAFNDRRLAKSLHKALENERKTTEAFNMVKLGGLHYIKEEL